MIGWLLLAAAAQAEPYKIRDETLCEVVHSDGIEDNASWDLLQMQFHLSRERIRSIRIWCDKYSLTFEDQQFFWGGPPPSRPEGSDKK